MPFTNIQSDLMSNALTGLCIYFFPNPTIKFLSWDVIKLQSYHCICCDYRSAKKIEIGQH